MRKGYGPTGVSFGFPFKDFKQKIDNGNTYTVELIIEGNCFYPVFDFASHTESELKAFYDAADCLDMSRRGDHGYMIQMFA